MLVWSASVTAGAPSVASIVWSQKKLSRFLSPKFRPPPSLSPPLGLCAWFPEMSAGREGHFSESRAKAEAENVTIDEFLEA